MTTATKKKTAVSMLGERTKIWLSPEQKRWLERRVLARREAGATGQQSVGLVVRDLIDEAMEKEAK